MCGFIPCYARIIDGEYLGAIRTRDSTVADGTSTEAWHKLLYGAYGVAGNAFCLGRRGALLDDERKWHITMLRQSHAFLSATLDVGPSATERARCGRSGDRYIHLVR